MALWLKQESLAWGWVDSSQPAQLGSSLGQSGFAPSGLVIQNRKSANVANFNKHASQPCHILYTSPFVRLDSQAILIMASQFKPMLGLPKSDTGGIFATCLHPFYLILSPCFLFAAFVRLIPRNSQGHRMVSPWWTCRSSPTDHCSEYLFFGSDRWPLYTVLSTESVL